MSETKIKPTYVATVIFTRNDNSKVSREYNYKVDGSMEFQVGDFAVVPSQYGLDYAVVEVVAIYEKTLENAAQFNKATSWVIDKVDISAHKARVEKAERLEFIKAELQAEKEKLEEAFIFEALAKSNPELAEKVNEFKTLTLEMK